MEPNPSQVMMKGGAEKIRRFLSDISNKELGKIAFVSGFWWEKTQEGYEYWVDIDYEYRKTGILTDEIRAKLELLVVEWEMFK